MAVSLILVRHGAKRGEHKGHCDPCDPLADCGITEATLLAPRLLELCWTPDVILSSEYQHARDTATVLAQGFGFPLDKVVPMPFLTPDVKTPRWNLRRHRKDQCHICLAQERRNRSGDWLRQACATLSAMRTPAASGDVLGVWVGHETRLSQLVLRFTGRRGRQLEILEAVCLEGESTLSFLQGKAAISWRYPVRNWLEEEVRDKLTSKMTVATLLASANFIGMFEILINKPKVLRLGGLEDSLVPPPWLASVASWLDGIAVDHALLRAPSVWVHSLATSVAKVLPGLAFLLFAFAATLFICTVYLYDRLAMPSGFWTISRPPQAMSRSKRKRDQAELHGAPYFHMVRIWKYVFTPAVGASFLAVAMLVVSLGHWFVTLAFAASCILGYVCFRHFRPSRYVD